MFRHCHHVQGAYTKISLKHTAINSLQQTYIVVMLMFMQFPIPLRYILDFDEYRIIDPSMIFYVKIHTRDYQ